VCGETRPFSVLVSVALVIDGRHKLSPTRLSRISLCSIAVVAE
jgi:hypothetical protein